ncbi:hypothetical protein Pyn_08454 [Prunus yedoensis var. nudiflora]|uniref:Ankyrin repeat-containing protein n=1 Tax=Prunus yedoensis var. nudiflora TaxID=2094558 RepID=A0A314YSD7_PRUYE|nr:hypothetical protein Pyn_08454 [Prunus yedoensis var. nudiflora]
MTRRSTRILLGWIQHVDMDEVLQWTDVEGNTVLHIATARNQFQAKLLSPHSLTVIELFEERDVTDRKMDTCGYLSKCCMSNENRNTLLVVAVLIATATFQAVLSPLLVSRKVTLKLLMILKGMPKPRTVALKKM